MTVALALTGGSALTLLILLVLLKKEASRGERVVLGQTREHLDHAVLRCGSMFERIFGHFRAGVFRATFHYILHQILGVVITGLTKAQRKMFLLYDRHTRISRQIQKEHETHLDAIAAHKEETALTETQKRKLKSRL